VGNFYFWPLLGQKNTSYPSRKEIHALSTWTIIKNEYFVAKSIELATKRVADRSPYDHKRSCRSMGRHTYPQLSRTVARTVSPYLQGREFKGYFNYETDRR